MNTKLLKSLFAVTLTAIISLNSFFVYADDSSTIYSGECGTNGSNVTWSYNNTTQTLTFSGTGSIDSIGGTLPKWCEQPITVSRIVYEDGITNIGYMNDFQYQSVPDVSNPLANNYWKLTDGYTVTIPESVTEWSGWYNDATYYVPYGSKFYYTCITKNPTVGTGIAENPYIAPTGTSDLGGTWSFDYATRILTLSGPGFFTGTEIPDYPCTSVIIDDSVTVPDNSENWEHDYSFYVSQFAFYYSNALYGNNKECKVYYSKDSSFGKAYQQIPENFQDEHFVASDDASVLYGDANLDGKIDITDAVLLGKAISGSVSFNALQQKAADCNANGTVDTSDSTILLQFLVGIITALPVTD